MCGIVGFNWADQALIKEMTNVLKHRGPNDSGFYVDKSISLGHRRLSIIDLSAKASQPMMNKDGSIILIFNGEIYNFKNIKKDLIQNGSKFFSDSDTEVILHGYEKYGEKIFSILDGMFAIALWDKRNKKLFLARDRMGKKPIYYYFKNGEIVFSSEIKAILSYPNYKKEIDYQCLSNYLSLRYSSDNRTMFKDIFKVKPGSYLSLQNSKLSTHYYWHLPKLIDKYIPNEKEVDSLIEESIRKRLVSDVPIGMFLSGGLDSSTMVAYLSRLGYNSHTFSVGFGDDTDETRYAELVASKFNTVHKTIRLDSNIISVLPRVVYHFDEPLADPAAVPTYKLCKEVSKSVRVALSGEGGDETFGGYQDFNYIKRINLVSKIPRFLGEAVSPLFAISSKMFRYPLRQKFMLASEIIRDPKDLAGNQKRLFYLPFNEAEKIKLLSKPQGLDYKDALDHYLNLPDNPWNNAIKYYFHEWLPNDLLMKGDKMSMANGLELRMPFLDNDLISYFCRINHRYKQDRLLFRKVVSKILPQEIMGRKKQGFILPISRWFNDKTFRDRITQHISDLNKRGIFDRKEIEHIIIAKEKFKNDHKLWSLLNFELWLKIYFDGINPDSIVL